MTNEHEQQSKAEPLPFERMLDESEPDIIKRSNEGLRTEEELVQQFHRQSQREHLTYLPMHWLHHGRDVLRLAHALIIRKPGDNSYKGIEVTIEVWKRYEGSHFYFKQDSRIHLKTEETSELLTYLRQAKAAADVEEDIAVPFPAAEIFDNLDAAQRQTFANILNDLALSDRIATLFNADQLTTQTIEHLAAAAQQIKYKAELRELCDMIDGKKTKTTKAGKTKSLDEQSYQTWFEAHPWVFGTEYIRRIDLRDIDPHASVDIILETTDGFFDVLELKTPEAEVLIQDKSHKTWFFSADVAKALAQAAKYLDAIERNTDKLHRETRAQVLFVRPRIRIIIGRTTQWKVNQHEAFRRLGATLHSIEIMTFDHVVKRAQQLIDRYEHPSHLETVRQTESDV
jgi:hypothetical protein